MRAFWALYAAANAIRSDDLVESNIAAAILKACGTATVGCEAGRAARTNGRVGDAILAYLAELASEGTGRV